MRALSAHLFLRLGMVGLILTAVRAHAQPAGAAMQCDAAANAAETAFHVPDAFLDAIARVESGRLQAGMVQPWPWTVDADGQGSFYATKEDAIAAVQAMQARGIRSIDVGCMQVNLLQHPEAFRSLQEAFDPVANARFAAQLLVSLFGQFGSWPLAAAAYHSQTPGIGAAYQKQVLAAWALPKRALAQRTGMANGTPQAQPPPAPKHPEAPSTAPAAMPGPAFGRVMSAMGGDPPHKAGPPGTGRDLASYRAIPVRLALRAPPAG